MEYNRKIKTNLEATNKNYEILRSVIGQMSDGIWENSPRAEGYWRFATIEKSDDNKIVIAVSTIHIISYSNIYGKYYHRNDYVINRFANMTDDKVKAYFANKIKQIIKIEESNLKEYYNDTSKDLSWRKDNQQKCGYMGYNETITVADAYAAYKNLKTSIQR